MVCARAQQAALPSHALCLTSLLTTSNNSGTEWPMSKCSSFKACINTCQSILYYFEQLNASFTISLWWRPGPCFSPLPSSWILEPFLITRELLSLLPPSYHFSLSFLYKFQVVFVFIFAAVFTFLGLTTLFQVLNFFSLVPAVSSCNGQVCGLMASQTNSNKQKGYMVKSAKYSQNISWMERVRMCD